MRQLNLLAGKKYNGRKMARAISVRHFNHVILKSRLPILRRHHAQIKNAISEAQRRFGIRLSGRIPSGAECSRMWIDNVSRHREPQKANSSIFNHGKFCYP